MKTFGSMNQVKGLIGLISLLLCLNLSIVSCSGKEDNSPKTASSSSDIKVANTSKAIDQEIPKPEFFGIYLLDNDRKLIKIDPAGAYYSVGILKNWGDVTKLNELTYWYVDKKSVVGIKSDNIQGFIVYLENIDINDFQLAMFSTIRDFMDDDSQGFFENKGKAESGSINHWINTKWMFKSENFGIKKIGDSMYYVKPLKVDFNAGFKYRTIGNKEKYANIVGVSIGKKFYIFSVTPLEQSQLVIYLSKLGNFDRMNKCLWDMHESGKYTENYMLLVDSLSKSTVVGHLDTIAWAYKDHGKSSEAIKLYEERILPVIKQKGDNKELQIYMGYFEKIKEYGKSSNKKESSGGEAVLRVMEQYYKQIPQSTRVMPDTPEAMRQWYEGDRIVDKEVKKKIVGTPQNLSQAESIKSILIYSRCVAAKAGFSPSKSFASVVQNLSKDIKFFNRCSDDLGIGYCKFYAPNEVQIIENSGKPLEYFFYPDEIESAKELIGLIKKYNALIAPRKPVTQ